MLSSTRHPGREIVACSFSNIERQLSLYSGLFKVEDPDPSNPWTLDEIYEIMESERNIDPDCWNMWVLLAGSYRSGSTAGFMFDKKQRKGCVLFLDHPWFKGNRR